MRQIAPLITQNYPMSESSPGQSRTLHQVALFRQLERPWLYRLAQSILSPGAEQGITRQIRELLAVIDTSNDLRIEGGLVDEPSEPFSLPPTKRILDVGCGPDSWLWRVNERPVGIDISSAYTYQYHQMGEPVATASATDLPFHAETFDGVWTVGVLHHIPDDLASRTILEMLRVCRSGGYIAILDAVLPEPAWKRPLAYVLRRADRGRFVRRQDQSISLLPGIQDWKIRRCTYSINGLELIIFYTVKGRILSGD